MVVIGVVVVAAIGGVALLMKNKSDKAALELAKMKIADSTPIQMDHINVTQEIPGDYGGTSPSNTFTRQIDVENSSSQGWVGIPSNQRKKASATLEIGDQGMINDQIPCTITSFYIDKNGKKGAFKCEGQDYYEIPGGSRFEW